MKYTDPYRQFNELEYKQTWNRIQASISSSPKSVPTPYAQTTKFRFFAKEYIAVLLVVFLLSSTTSLAAAADSSLPTSVLYGIKINVTEPLRGLTKTTPQAKISWEIERTSRRLDETRQLIESKTLTPEIAVDLSHNIEKQTAKAQDEISELAEDNNQESTILSLSLVETIEKKKEDIAIAVESINNEPDEPLEIELEETEINEIAPEATTLDLAESPSTAPEASLKSVNSDLLATAEKPKTKKELIEKNIAPSVMSILSVADQAQAKTNTLITALKKEKKEQDQISSKPDSSLEDTQELNVVTYTLILKDIQTQISNIEELLDLEEKAVTEDITIETDTLIQSDTELVDSNDSETTKKTETNNDKNSENSSSELLQNTPDSNETKSQADKIEVEPTPTKLQTLTSITSTTAEKIPDTAPQTNESDIDIIETPASEKDTTPASSSDTESDTTIVTPELTTEEQLRYSRIERYKSISAEFENLKLVTVPTETNITKAREVRKRAQTLIQEISPKTKEENPEILPVETLKVIPEIKVNTVETTPIPAIVDPSQNTEKSPTSAQPASSSRDNNGENESNSSNTSQ